MRNLFNILIMVFVVGTMYYEIKHNNVPGISFEQTSKDIQSLQNQIPKTIKSVFAPLANLSNLSLNNFNLDIFDGLGGSSSSTTASNTTEGAPSEIAPSLPGPLTKIETKTPDKTVAGTNTQISTEGKLTIEGIIIETNAQRKKQLVSGLVESSSLNASARLKATDILKRQYFEHVAPDGKTVSDLVAEEGYTYIKIGENLALGNFESDKDVVTAWMNSPGHRANILDPQFTQIGVGVAFGMYKGQMVGVAVQHFGRPRSDCPPIDDSLKTKVQQNQSDLETLSASLQKQKAVIDAGRAEGNPMNAEVDAYNQGVDVYQAKYAEVEGIRTTYNAEVLAFNNCIAKVQ